MPDLFPSFSSRFFARIKQQNVLVASKYNIAMTQAGTLRPASPPRPPHCLQAGSGSTKSSTTASGGKAKAHRCFSTPKISSSITSRGTNHSEGSRGNSRVAPTTDSRAGRAPIAPASPSPERGEDHHRKNDTEQNKTDRAHGSSPSPSFRRMLCDCSRYLGSQELGGSKEKAPGVPGLQGYGQKILPIKTDKLPSKRCG